MFNKVVILMPTLYSPLKSLYFMNHQTHSRRADCNYVGLKNGGATCYINSVLQQLYAVPGVAEQLLAVNLDKVDEDSAFFQLQV